MWVPDTLLAAFRLMEEAIVGYNRDRIKPDQELWVEIYCQHGDLKVGIALLFDLFTNKS